MTHFSCMCDIPLCLTNNGKTSHCIDLSHTLDSDTVFWPGGEGFSLCMTCISSENGKAVTTMTTTSSHDKTVTTTTEMVTGDNESSFYSAGIIKCSEHGGTHVDAPFHFCCSGNTVDLLPLRDLLGYGKVIDVSIAVQTNRDYKVCPEDIIDYEKITGRLLSKGDIVLIRTGWACHYRLGAFEYLGYDGTPYNSSTTDLSFPGIGEEAARLLVSRGVTAVGIDTASLDCGNNKDFIAHKILLGSGIYGIENINEEIEKLPIDGSFLMVMPMKIKGGSGAPARVIAFF